VTGPGVYSPGMDVVVFGKHVEVSADLRALTHEKLERINKFANDVRRVDVDYDELATRRPADSHTCEILVHLNKHLVKAFSAAGDHVAALDGALDKVEQQMRRLHDRRVHRRNGAKNDRSNGGAGSVADTTGRDAALVPSDADGEVAGGEVVVVKSKQFAVKPMDVEEAALQMELLGHDFFLFTRAETGSAAVLYRRRDGTLGMIEAAG
jgi:ribosomal subunit interface protein